MFEDYRKKVKAVYEKMKDTPAFSMNLRRLTDVKLKKECIRVYSERYSSKDDYMLVSFFGSLSDKYPDYGQVIKSFEESKFKPLKNFLNGDTMDPDEKHIELLAWLIDFDQRPYSVFERSWNEDRSQNEDGDEQVPMPGPMPEPGPDIPKLTKRPLLLSKVIMTIFSVAVIITISIAYLLIDNEPQQCMYWTGDHYQSISCNKKIENTTIIAMDSVKLNGLKRITEPDTLTAGSLGKVWYVKVDGDLEFYTAAGYHPLDDNKRLRPLTVTILNNHPNRK